MPLPTYTAVFTAKEQLASNIWQLTTTKPTNFTFAPGQFVLWNVPSIIDVQDVQPRAYSIASHPTEAQLHFVFKYEVGGRASEWVQQVVAPGIEYTFQGPLGAFTLPQNSTAPIIFAATSTGIAPIMAMLKELQIRQYTAAVQVVFGVRTQADAFWLQELETCIKNLPNAQLQVLYSAPTAGFTGTIGRIQTRLYPLIQTMPAAQVFACGNPQMTLEVKKWCLQECSLPKSQVHIEGFL